jgi:hypothetical protein
VLLEVKDKFALFIQDTFDPVSFLAAGFNAGLDQAANNDSTFGQGAGGYGKRVGTQFAGQTAFRFFTEFAYPTIFSEDPRYYRLGHGSGGSRFLHAAACFRGAPGQRPAHVPFLEMAWNRQRGRAQQRLPSGQPTWVWPNHEPSRVFRSRRHGYRRTSGILA